MSVAAEPLLRSDFSEEQKRYLEGFFAGIRARGQTFGETEKAPTSTEPDLSSLIKEERIKRELHPLDAYVTLLEDAQQNKAPDPENLFRYKWNGLFFLTPLKDSYMARLRIPGGFLKTYQLREIAHVSKELTSGYVQITTRANFQIRLIQPKDAPEVLRRIQSVGLHTRGAGADNIRNLTANPTAGIDPHELIDVTRYTHDLAQIILSSREFYDLPRKFNIALDGGGLIGSVEDTNDIGVKAVQVKETPDGPAAGVYFRIKLGGATGHKAFAKDIGVLVKPQEMVKVVVALVRVFIKNGNRTDRKKARLKHLLESWTLDQYLAETEKLLGYKLIRAPYDAQGLCACELPETTPEFPHSHVGVFPQRQEGLSYVGVTIPVGQLSPTQMLKLADLADEHGCGEVRLTVWQNLIIPGVPNDEVLALKKGLIKMGLGWEQSHLRSGFIACTGNSYCKFASSNTKGQAIELMEYLDKRIHLDQPINVHLTGCAHSCAQHYMGDIGLLATKVKLAGETVEGYHVFVGGGFGKYQAVGRQVFTGVAFEDLKATLERIFKAYLKHRQPQEPFQAFSNRYDLNTLQALFSNEE